MTNTSATSGCRSAEPIAHPIVRAEFLAAMTTATWGFAILFPSLAQGAIIDLL